MNSSERRGKSAFIFKEKKKKLSRSYTHVYIYIYVWMDGEKLKIRSFD